jgi:hypothetical protein
VTKEPPVLTGISARFTEDPNNPGRIVIQIHVLLEEDDSIIHDMEIFYDQQEKPWQGIEPIQWPPGWEAKPIEQTDPTGETHIIGIHYVTGEFPLRTCQPVIFDLVVLPPDTLGNFIKIYLTDKDHKVIGQVAAQRVTPAHDANPFAAGGMNAWLATVLDPQCGP